MGIRGISALILVCFFLIPKDLLSQDVKPSEYVIITYELTRAKDTHGVRKYYWMVSVDSLKGQRVSLSPIYFTGFAKNNLDRCCQNEVVDIFTVTTGSTYDFKEGYEQSIEELVQLVDRERRKVQTITKEWTTGYNERIKIYATPIIGKFCRCDIGKEDGNKINYKGMVYLPLSDFSFNANFWKSKSANEILLKDLTKISIGTSPFDNPGK